MFEVYILYSSSICRFYTGQTSHLKNRIDKHNSGLVKSTKGGIPWSIVHSIKVESRAEALELEKKIKKRGAKRFLENLKN